MVSEPEEVPQAPADPDDLEQTVQEHMAVGDVPMASEEKRKAEALDNETTASEAPATTWKPVGGSDALRWQKKPRVEDKGDVADTYNVTKPKKILTAKLKKKMLDKEIPFKKRDFVVQSISMDFKFYCQVMKQLKNI